MQAWPNIFEFFRVHSKFGEAKVIKSPASKFHAQQGFIIHDMQLDTPSVVANAVSMLISN
jgi:hypothetical protein